MQCKRKRLLRLQLPRLRLKLQRQRPPPTHTLPNLLLKLPSEILSHLTLHQVCERFAGRSISTHQRTEEYVAKIIRECDAYFAERIDDEDAEFACPPTNGFKCEQCDFVTCMRVNECIWFHGYADACCCTKRCRHVAAIAIRQSRVVTAIRSACSYADWCDCCVCLRSLRADVHCFA
jgi:hypothetical protein